MFLEGDNADLSREVVVQPVHVLPEVRLSWYHHGGCISLLIESSNSCSVSWLELYPANYGDDHDEEVTMMMTIMIMTHL